MSKMAKKGDLTKQSMIVYPVDPTECPFREFRDNELSVDVWGMGPAAFRASHVVSKVATKPHGDQAWVDDQTQPLPRSVRQHLHGWMKAEDLAMSRWEAEVVIFEDSNDGGKMSVGVMQLSHAQVLLRSSFCRSVLSMCYILERADNIVVEHQWENFAFSIGPEGWRARYHIYSPGLKPGGGAQHRPGLSKNGGRLLCTGCCLDGYHRDAYFSRQAVLCCYLVRLYYLGAWRCVWVSDLVPMDATDAPLLPFSPLLTNAPVKPGTRQAPAAATSQVVHLWPLLICKALLKLAAPDMNSDEGADFEDELMPEFDILHALTGAMNLTYKTQDPEDLWELLTSEVPVFSWDDDSDTVTSTIKSKSTKKPTTKETSNVRRGSLTAILIADTKGLPPYYLPGITPSHEMNLLLTMARDLPLKKPLPEPDVALWKTYRWVGWARRHGLYEAFDCPRTRFLKVNGLLKSSYAPHLLDVQSTESITFQFREEHDRTNPPQRDEQDVHLMIKKGGKDVNRSGTAAIGSNQQVKEELREWVQYDAMRELIKTVTILYYPSMYEFTTTASNPPIRITKTPANRALDIPAPKSGPLYLQIDGPDENVLRISLNMLHPRVLFNCGVPIVDHIEPAYLLLEVFEWFVDCELPMGKAFIATRGYDTVEVNFAPGRHFCRIWVHSRMNWTAMLLSESTLLLGGRDVIQSAAVRDCPWAARFLTSLSVAFSNWIRVTRSSVNLSINDKEFFNSYQPDLVWDEKVVGYNKKLLHWMFRQALQSLLAKRLLPLEFRSVCIVLRRLLHDPDFGFPPKPPPPNSLRDIVMMDPCDCVLPEAEEMELIGEQLEEQQVAEEKLVIDTETMDRLLSPPKFPVTSNVCELATEEVPCGVLKEEREKVLKKHEAARVIQAHWRGAWARKCLSMTVIVSADVTKTLMDQAFGNIESLSALMNEFFGMYPGARYAYSVASALSGVYGLQQHNGTTSVTPKCKWVPYFQGVFYCHGPVKVHFDVQSTLHYSTFAVYDNDTGEQMPQAYNAHVTFDFHPNEHGYTIMGHGTLTEAPGTYSDANWQLTVLSSISDIFHVCDNEDSCREVPLPPASKLHVDEIFIPNRRNILGGVHIYVSKYEAISFRAAATSPELEMEAILRTKTNNGEMEELGRCSGIGELYWPYIRLEPTPPLLMSPAKKRSTSHANLIAPGRESAFLSARSLKLAKPAKQSVSGAKSKSATKIRDVKVHQEPKQYCIEVIAPKGWPLTLQQWTRVGEVRNSHETTKVDQSPKKPNKEKSGSAKEKEKPAPVTLHQPQPGDAYVELECSLAIGGGSIARRDDDRDLEFAAARKTWDAKDVGRNLRGAQIRKEFRAEFLEALPVPPSESAMSMQEEVFPEEAEGEQKREPETQQQQGPTPATESGVELEAEEESEEESTYLTMPDQLNDKFIPLVFVPLCTKEKIEGDSVLSVFSVEAELAERAKVDRQASIDVALQRMQELQRYNELYVLGRQKRRGQLLEKLFVDSQWNPDLAEVLEERDDAIGQEALNRTLSANKKKQEAKKK